jgi:hypothetical protein
MIFRFGTKMRGEKMEMNVIREPAEAAPPLIPLSYKASLHVEPTPGRQSNYLALRFNTGGKERGSLFHTSIAPSSFTELAKLMMQADPSAAITAFGAVMLEMPVLPAVATEPTTA